MSGSKCSSPVLPETNHHWLQGEPRDSGFGIAEIDEECTSCDEEQSIFVKVFDDDDWAIDEETCYLNEKYFREES